MRKLFFMMLASSALFACGTEPEDGGSSSSTSTSTPSSGGTNSSSSTPAASIGDAVAGEAAFTTSGCVGCHEYQGNGFFDNSGEPFSIADLLSSSGYGSVQALADYIEDQMPVGNTGSCVGDCALDTAAFMASKLSDVGSGPVTAAGSACSESEPVTYGVRTLQPLTANEYRNTIVQAGLVSQAEAAALDLPGDVVRTKSDYPVHSALRIEGTRALSFDKAAFAVADIAASNLAQQCGNDENNCASQFLDLAYQLHRQPLDAEEQQLYTGMFSEFGALDGMRTAIAAALTSPQFLYRSEMGVSVQDAQEQGIAAANLSSADSSAYVLTPYEFASQLAFMYTGTGPSQSLLEQAESGGLDSAAGIDQVIDQLINSDAGRTHVEQFGGIWFRANDVVDESRPSFPEFTPEIAQDMSTEVRKLFAHIWYSDDLTLEDLYAGDFTVINSRLGQFYGSGGSGGVDDWQVSTVANRGGLLTTGAFHAAYANDLHTRPILKAVKVRDLMLCHHVGAPQNMLADDAAIAENQAAIVATLRDGGGSATAREYYEASTVADGCQVCHETQINPLFGLDDFDQIGRYRSTQTGLILVDDAGNYDLGNSGVAVDDSGELIGLSDLNDSASFSFNGAKDLGEKMAALPTVAECMVVNTFRYTTGLAIDRDNIAKNGSTPIPEDVLSDEQAEDFACAKDILMDTYQSSGKRPLEVYRQMGKLDLVRYRK